MEKVGYLAQIYIKCILTVKQLKCLKQQKYSLTFTVLGLLQVYFGSLDLPSSDWYRILQL